MERSTSLNQEESPCGESNSQIRLSSSKNFSFGLFTNPQLQLQQRQEEPVVSNFDEYQMMQNLHQQVIQKMSELSNQKQFQPRILKKDHSNVSTLSNSPPPINLIENEQIQEPVFGKKPMSSQSKQNPYAKNKQIQNQINNTDLNKTDNTLYLDANSTNVIRDDALKLINTQKFIQQNNFIPVPPIINSGVNQLTTMGNIPPQLMTAISFYPSGENIVQPKIPSRQEQRRPNHYISPIYNNSTQRKSSTMLNGVVGPFEQTLRRNREEVKRRSTSRDVVLTVEQRMMIENASEEQGGNSDQSFEEKFINVSSEQINRLEGNDDEDNDGDSDQQEDSSPQLQSQRFSLGNTRGAIRANHQIEINTDPSSNYFPPEIANESKKSNYQISSRRYKQPSQSQKPPQKISQFTKRTIFSNNQVTKKENPARKFSQNKQIIIQSHNKSLSEVYDSKEYDEEEKFSAVKQQESFRFTSKTPINNYLNKLQSPMKVNQAVYDSPSFFVRSHSSNRNAPQIIYNQQQLPQNYQKVLQLSRSSNLSNRSSVQSIYSSRSGSISDQNENQNKNHSNPRARGRKIVKSTNPQFIQTQKINYQVNSSNQQTPSSINFGFGLQTGKSLHQKNTQQLQNIDNEQKQQRSERVKEALRQIIKENQVVIEQQQLQVREHRDSSNNVRSPIQYRRKFNINSNSSNGKFIKNSLKLKQLDSISSNTNNQNSQPSQRTKRDPSEQLKLSHRMQEQRETINATYQNNQNTSNKSQYQKVFHLIKGQQTTNKDRQSVQSLERTQQNHLI